MGLERCPVSVVSTIEELLERKSSGPNRIIGKQEINMSEEC
jgi:hypothetical protein